MSTLNSSRRVKYSGYVDGSSPYDSLSSDQVRRLVKMTAEVRDMTYEGAARLLAERWEERALDAKQKGLSSWIMWDRLGMMALEETR